MKINWEKLRFTDVQGIPRIIRGVPASHIDEWELLITWLSEVTAEEMGDRSFEEFYAHHTETQHLIDRALELAGISLDWVSPSMIRQMFGGEAWLVKSVFGYAIEQEEDATQTAFDSRLQFKSHLQAALVSVGLCQDAIAAEQLMSKHTVQEIEILINERQKQLGIKPTRQEERITPTTASSVFAPDAQYDERLKQKTEEMLAKFSRGINQGQSVPIQAFDMLMKGGGNVSG